MLLLALFTDFSQLQAEDYVKLHNHVEDSEYKKHIFSQSTALKVDPKNLIRLKTGSLADQADSGSCLPLRRPGLILFLGMCGTPPGPLLTNTDRPTHQPATSCFTTAALLALQITCLYEMCWF